MDTPGSKKSSEKARRLDRIMATSHYTSVAITSIANGSRINVARKKAEGESKQNNPTSYRFSSETVADLDALKAEFKLSHTAILEAGVKLVRKGLAKVTEKDVLSALGLKKIPRDGP
jgi:hypothetical protein